jgi:hypothetical protein
MSHKLDSAIAVIGIDIGKNSFHVVGHDKRGAIMLRQKWSRGQVETRLANLPPCLIGMEACVGAAGENPIARGCVSCEYREQRNREASWRNHRVTRPFTGKTPCGARRSGISPRNTNK